MSPLTVDRAATTTRILSRFSSFTNGVTAAPTDASPRVHPTVRLDFLVRISTFPFYCLLYGVHVWPRGVTPWFWVLIGGHMIVWPPLARFIATRSRDSKHAELRNLLIDSFIVGSYVPFTGFSIWPNIAGLVGVHSGNMAVGGGRHAVRGLFAFAFGSIVSAVLTQQFTQEFRGASLLTELLSCGMIIVFTSVFSLQSYVQSQRNVRNLRQIRDQNAQIAEKGELLEERTRQVELARDAAEAANVAKSSFLANMSHELRTPLNAIIGYSEMLIEEADDTGAGELTPDLEKIRSSGKHLLGLINDVLDLSKIEAGRMELYLESFDVGDLLTGVASTVRPLVQKNRSTLEVEAAPGLGSIRADLTRVRQVLLNLLSNASKFTEAGRITLRASREATPEGEDVVFVISDSGIGMSEEQMARLFRPFTQADASTTRKYGGTGLGLVITKHFVEMMGGVIEVASEPGRGTSFTVRLPVEVLAIMYTVEMPIPTEALRAAALSASAATGAGTALETSAVASEGTILIIDDDAATRDLVSRSLEREGYIAVSAASGEQGIRMARELHPNAITLDVLMPGLDGWAVLRALKADPDLAHIPVVMLIGAVDPSLADGLGAAASLSKPFDRAALLAALRQSPESSKVANGRRVLIVEDDAVARELLRRTLERQGYSVAEAEDGEAALACLETVVPSLIILDLLMPRLDGFGFLDALRARAEWKSVPVIVVSAKCTTDGERTRLQSASAILQKGTDSAAELLRAVESVEHR